MASDTTKTAPWKTTGGSVCTQAPRALSTAVAIAGSPTQPSVRDRMVMPTWQAAR
jgi:hypothetical protein